MGTLASKVGENIVGKRLGMSEKDRKLLGTVFGMAGGAYGGYAGSAGFGSSGIGASGSAGGMGGQSPKVGGDYGTAMNLYSQPQPQTFTGFNQPMSAAYNSPQTFTGVDAPFSSMASGNGYAGTPYQPIEASNNPYISQYVGNADAPADIGYFANPVKPNPYLGPNVGNADAPAALFQMNSPINDASVMNDWQAGIGGNPVYQGPLSLDTSAQTFALDSPSRTIDLAPSGTPLEVVDASAYTSPPEPFYGVDPNSPTASGSNLGMESVYNSGGNPDIELVPSTGDGYLISPDDQVRLIQANTDGTFTELPANTDLSTSQGVEEFINMDKIRADEMPGGPLDPFGTGPNISAANSRVPLNIGDNYGGEAPYIVDTPPLADINSGQDASTVARGNFDAKMAQKRFIRKGPRLEDFDNLDVAIQNTPTARLESLDNAVLNSPTIASGRAPMTEDAIKRAQDVMSESEQARLDTRDIERETQSIADAINYEIPPAEKASWLDKIPQAVKEWATMTGVSLLDMWIKQSLFGQDYDDQIAEGGGGGGGVLRGSSPVVSPYSGGGSGGGGKGVLFSMGGSGQQGRGTHIMALQ